MTSGGSTRFARALPPRSVLVIVTRRIGDVQLATPLIRSLRRSWPDAAIDALVFAGTEGALAGNPDVRRVLAVPQRLGRMRHLSFAAALFRRYELALSLVPGDRPTLYAFIAGRWRAGLLLDIPRERWKQRLLDSWIPFDDRNTHTVRMHLAIAKALNVSPRGEIVLAWRAEDMKAVDGLLGERGARPFAVLHPYPKFNYKMWRRAGWIELAHWLAARGYPVVLTGSGEAAEVEYLSDLAREMPPETISAAGALSFGASACLVSRAALYVGADTAMTHAAAASGVTTIALFGPSNPVKWGPWPRNHSPETNPWRRCGTQRVGNVTLLQPAHACVPCLLEGCDRGITSFSDCLQALPTQRVTAAIEQALAAQA